MSGCGPPCDTHSACVFLSNVFLSVQSPQARALLSPPMAGPVAVRPSPAALWGPVCAARGCGTPGRASCHPGLLLGPSPCVLVAPALVALPAASGDCPPLSGFPADQGPRHVDSARLCVGPDHPSCSHVCFVPKPLLTCYSFIVKIKTLGDSKIEYLQVHVFASWMLLETTPHVRISRQCDLRFPVV